MGIVFKGRGVSLGLSFPGNPLNKKQNASGHENRGQVMQKCCILQPMTNMMLVVCRLPDNNNLDSRPTEVDRRVPSRTRITGKRKPETFRVLSEIIRSIVISFLSF